MRCVLPLACLAASASAQSTYVTTTGTLNLVAGLTTLTDTSAVNAGATPGQLGHITDDSWSTTGILNIGNTNQNPNGGSLAGTFGGGAFYSSTSSIILIGAYSTGSPVAWDEFDVSLLLSTGVYTQARHYTNADVTLNPTVMTDPGFVMYNSANNQTLSIGATSTAYLLLSISSFDTANVGVTGIKVSHITPASTPILT